jgi:5-methylcytosine-specific restriction endonuclease McrA
MSNYALVLDTNKRPLDPVHPSTARLLLNQQKAAVFRRFPFTIILKVANSNAPTQPIQLKIDPGSKITGIALVQNDKVIWAGELQHRGSQIKDSLLTRRAIRRSRRSKHTRRSKARFLNRTRALRWLAPSLQHRINTTLTWVNKLIKFAPITGISQELVRFDLQQLENPEISGIEYQQGTLLGYEIREYLLNKWNRKCAYCNAENIALQVEHIKPRAKGGSSRISNLCLACDKCNIKKGTQDIEKFLAKKLDLLSSILKQAKAPLKDAAAVNSTRYRLFSRLKETGLNVVTGSGGLTKFNRTRLGLPKSHWIDAACVGKVEILEVVTTKPLLIACKGKGTRRLCRINKFGFPCSKPRTSYEHEWNTGDIMSGFGIVGRVVVQSDIRLEIRVDGKRIGGRLSDFRKLHNKDSYSYA